MNGGVGTEEAVVLAAGDEELAEALRAANLPTLLLVLAQLTGDERWTGDRYRPNRTVGMNDNDDAGLSPELQDELRQGAFEVLRDWRDNPRPLPAPPGDEALLERMAYSLGEDVPAEFGPVMAQEAGFRRRDVGWSAGRPPEAAAGFHVLVIGAGFSGLAAAITFEGLGVPFTVVERNAGVGGTWLDNGYPGAAVDTPSHLYSYSFAPNRSWSHYYARRHEILAYIERTAEESGTLDRFRFHTEVTGARWDEASQRWEVSVTGPDGPDTLTADVVISAVGQLNRPSVPPIPGLDSFAGPLFHSARWDHSVDITGQRVAVVGTGASAMQIVPAIAGVAGKVVIFQRSPQWVIPNPNYLRAVPEGTRLLMEQVPFYATFYRLKMLHQFQDKLHPTIQKDPDWPHPERSLNAKNEQHRLVFVRSITDQVTDPELLAKVMPDYPPYGKRILMDNNWYKTLLRDDVDLVDQEVTAFEPDAVVTADGRRHEVDVVVMATGFQARKLLGHIDVRGRDGLALSEVWGEDDPRAYLGMTMPRFPNLFVMYGPNTNLGHGGSAVYNTECQVGYVAQLVVEMIERGLASVEVHGAVHDEYNARVDAAHEQMIWTHPGMSNWYRNAAGRVVTNSPWRSVDYWHMTEHADLGDFLTTPRIAVSSTG